MSWHDYFLQVIIFVVVFRCSDGIGTNVITLTGTDRHVILHSVKRAGSFVGLRRANMLTTVFPNLLSEDILRRTAPGTHKLCPFRRAWSSTRATAIS